MKIILTLLLSCFCLLLRAESRQQPLDYLVTRTMEWNYSDQQLNLALRLITKDRDARLEEFPTEFSLGVNQSVIQLWTPARDGGWTVAACDAMPEWIAALLEGKALDSGKEEENALLGEFKLTHDAHDDIVFSAFFYHVRTRTPIQVSWKMKKSNDRDPGERIVTAVTQTNLPFDQLDTFFAAASGEKTTGK